VPEPHEVAPAAASSANDTRPEPGELQLQGRRAWKSWQLVLAVLVAVFIGMAINGNLGSAASSGSGGGSSYALPPPTSGGGTTATTSPGGRNSGGTGSSGSTGTGGTASSTTTTTAAGAGAAGSSTTATTAAGGSPSGAGAGAGGTTATTAPLGQESYLVPEYQSSGNWTSAAFNVAGSTWYIGWAFQCNPVPAAKPTFSVYVVTPPGSSPSGTPAVTSNDPQGQSVTSLTSTGSQQLVVQAPPQCKWAVKVTGYGGG
jgi:hypothetical protein